MSTTIPDFSAPYITDSLEISENSGRYMEMTMPPTSSPNSRISRGYRAVNRSDTAASTSSS